MAMVTTTTKYVRRSMYDDDDIDSGDDHDADDDGNALTGADYV